MAELLTLARPYAKAAFESAQQVNQLAEWSAMLGFAAEVVKSPEVKALLKHPRVSAEMRAQLVQDVCAGKMPESGNNFIRVLADNHRLPLLPEIAELFASMKARFEQSVDVDVSSPFELTPEQEDKLAQALSRKLQRKVNVTSAIDRSLIGGVLVRAGDLVIDASVRGKLAKLVEALGT